MQLFNSVFSGRNNRHIPSFIPRECDRTFSTHNKRIYAVWILVLALVLNACGGSGEGLDQTGRPIDENPPVDNTPKADFAFLQSAVFTPVCTVCHAGGAAPVGLRLDSANSYDSLVSVASVQAPGTLRVAPGDPDNSYLIQKLEGTAAVGGQMPLGGPPLDTETLALFRQWVADGALPPDTSVPPTTPPTVLAVSPINNDVLSVAPSSITVEFSQAMDPALVSATTVELLASGGDGGFADGNEVALVPAGLSLSQTTTMVMDLTGVTLADDVYRVRLAGSGTTSLADLGGLLLDGDADGTAGGDFIWQFTIDSAAAGPEPAWRWIQDNVFTPVCTQCHVSGGIASFLLLDEANSYAMTVNVPSSGVPALDLIEPGDADNSYLMQKVEGTATVGSQMPLGQPPLGADVIAAMRTWIGNGALLEAGDPMPDVTAPIVTLDAPATPLTGVVMLTATATDDTAVTQVRFYVDGVLVGTDADAPYVLDWDTLTVANGAYNLSAEADDAAGNTGIAASVAVTVDNPPPVDNEAPTVAVNNPGSPLSGSVTVSVSATDNVGVSQVRLFINEALTATISSAPYNYTWATTDFANGSYSLRAEADDAAGNMGVSTTVTVSVDNSLPPDTELPTVTLTPPATPANGVIDVALTAADNIGVTEVRLYVDGQLTGTDTTAPYSITLDTTAFADGDHQLSAQAEDAAGNTGFASNVVITFANGGPQPTWRWVQDNVFTPVCAQCHVSGGIASFLLLDEANSYAMTVNVPSSGVPSLDLIEPFDADNSYLMQKIEGTAAVGSQMPLGQPPLGADVMATMRTWIGNGALLDPGDPTPDVTAPVVTIDAPAAPLTGVVMLSATATDDTAVTQVRFYVDGVLVGSDVSAPYEISWDTITVTNGTHALTAEADDGAGNTGIAASVTITVDNASDNEPPAVTVNDPGSPLSGSVTLSVSATDNIAVSEVRLFINDVLTATLATAPYDYVWLTTDIANGSYNLRAEADDAAGNTSVSSTVAVTVDNSPPPDIESPTVVVNNPGSPLSGSVNLSVTATDNVAVSEVRLFINDVLTATIASAPYDFTWVTTDVANGAYTLRAEADDAAGNVGVSSSLVVTVDNGLPPDTELPTVVLTPPATPASGLIDVVLTASDNIGVTEVRLYVDGILIGSDTTPPYAIALDTTTYTDGDHLFSAQAEDAAGNIGFAPTIVVAFVNGGPQPTFDWIQSNVFTQICTACHINGGIASFLPLDDANSYANLVDVPSTREPTLDRVEPGFPDLSYLVQRLEGGTAQVPQMPLGGQPLSVDTIAAIRQWITDGATLGPVDALAPVVTLSSPATPVSGTVSILVNAVDDVAVAEVRLLVNGTVVATDTLAPYDFAWDTTLLADGNYMLAAEADDTSGNTGASQIIDVEVANGVADVEAPTVVVQDPATTLSGTVTLVAQATDNVGVASVELFIDGVSAGTLTQSPFEFVIDTTTLIDGAHTVTATATDASGNSATSSPVTVTTDNTTPPDTTAPVVSVIPPSDPLSGTVSIGVTATDDVAVTLVRVLIDGVMIGTDTALPFSVDWDTTAVADGTYTLTAEAEDAAGNTGTASAVTVNVVNTVAPQPTWRWIQDNIFTPQCVFCHAPNASADFLHLTEAASYNQLVNAATTEGGPPLRVSPGNPDNSSLVQRLEGTLSPQMPLGGNPLPAADINAVRQWILDGAPPEIAADVTAPEVSFVSPGSTVSGTITVRAQATDNVGVTEVRFFVNGNLLATDISAPFEAIWDTTTVGDTTHTLTAEASDAAGNVGTSAAVAVVVDNTLPPDATAPTVTISPVTSPVSGNVSVEVMAQDDTGVTSVSLLVDGSLVDTVLFAPFVIDWNTLNTANGIHMLTATAGDAAGNIGTSAAVMVTVSNTEPVISIALAAPATVPRGDDFSVTATVSNAGTDSDALTATLTFSPPDALRIESPGSIQNLGILSNGTDAAPTWLMRADEEGVATITITVSNASNSINEQSQIDVTVTN